MSFWLVVSMLATPGAGALSIVRDLSQFGTGQLPRLGVLAATLGLVGGVFGLPESDSAVGAQGADDISYIYDATGRLRAVVDPTSDTAIYSYDAVGNVLSIARQASTVTSVVEVSPLSAPIGTTVTVEGAGFGATPGQNTVTFNGTAASVTSASATKLVVTVPAAATTGTVSVTAPGGSSTSSTPFTVAASTGAPTVGGFSPAGGEPGTVITLTGTNFSTIAQTNRVTVNGMQAQVDSATATSLTFKVPPGTNHGRIEVGTAEGAATSASDFLVLNAGGLLSGLVYGGRITVGSSGSVSVPDSSKKGILLFDGEAGQRVSVTFIGTGSNLRLMDPHGDQIALADPFGSGLVDAVNLPVTGTYTLLLEPQGGGGQITANLYTFTDIAGTIASNGTPTTVTTTVPGQNAGLTFEATAGQKVSVALSDSSFTNGIIASIVDDHGNIKGGPFGFGLGFFLEPITIDTAGTYTLLFNPGGAQTGSITAQLFTVTDISQPIAINGPPTSVTLTTPGQVALLTFGGTAGQNIRVDLTNGTFAGIGNEAQASLIGPGGSVVAGPSALHDSQTLGPITFGTSGTYTVLVNPPNADTGSFTAGVVLISCPTRGSATPQVVSLSTGKIQVTVNGGTPPLQSVKITTLSSTNARLLIGGQEYTGPWPKTLTSTNGAPIVFVLEKIDPGLAMTVPMEITDGCGSWQTFVGAGTGALDAPDQADDEYAIRPGVASAAIPPSESLSHLANAESAPVLAKVGPDTNGLLAEPTPLPVARPSSAEAERWVPTDANRRGNWQTGRPVHAPTGPVGPEPASIGTNGADLTIGGQPVSSIALTPPQPGRTRQDVQGATIWDGQILGPGGELRGRLELVPGERAGAVVQTGQTMLTGHLRDVNGQTLTTVSVTLEYQRSGQTAPGPGPAGTAISVRFHRQQLSRVGVQIGGIVSPGVNPGPVTPTGVTAPVGGSARTLAVDGRALRQVSVELHDVRPTLLPDATALSGQVLTLADEPLPDVTLRIGSVSAQTDRFGRFVLGPLADGHQVLTIDGRTSSAPGRVFGVFQAGVDLKAGQTNRLPFDVYLPRLDTAQAVAVPPTTTREVVLTTTQIPGLEIHIPPGAQIRDVDGRPATEVGITAIPLDRTPFPIPRLVDVPVFFTVQPGAATVDAPSGAWVVYPNYSNLPPGTRADFWQYDPKKRGWFVYGKGTVTSDGRQVVPDPNVRIYDFTGFMFNGLGWVPPDDAPQVGDGHDDGDPVNLETGLFVLERTDLALPDTLPLTLTRTYRPNDPNKRPFGWGSTHPYEIFLRSPGQSDYSQVDLILPNGARVHYPRISSGTGYADAIFEHASTPTAFYKSRIEYIDAGWHLTFQDGTVYRFGDNGPLQWIRDRYGNTTRIIRPILMQNNKDLSGPINRLISHNGRWITFTYDGSDRVTQARDNLGRTVTYEYTSGYLTRVTDPAGGVTEYTYDSYATAPSASGKLLTIKDPRGIVYLTNEYYADGRVKKQTQADTTTYQFAYTLNGASPPRVTQTDVTDPRGNVRRVTFNGQRRVISDTAALGTAQQQTVTYERRAADSFILSVTDPINRRATFTYDGQGNVSSITELAGTAQARTTTLTYEPAYQQVRTIVDPLNRTTRFTYDGRGNLTGVTDPLNHTTAATYDGLGRMKSIKDPLNNVTQLSYNGPDLVTVTDPLGRTSIVRPDGAGRILAAVDPLGNTARLEYDALNQLIRMTDPLGHVTAFTYDENGNLKTITDARNGVTQYAYNSMDRLTTRTDPLSRADTYHYDFNGNLDETTDRKGQHATVQYDPLDRPQMVTFADGSTITYTYDGPFLKQVSDSANGTIVLDYDEFDRLKFETSAQGTVTYGYDNADRLTSMTVTGQPTVVYGYDEADRLKTITQTSSVTTIEYDEADRRKSLSLPDGIVTEYGYDSASNLTSLVYKQGGATIGTLTYGLDLLGRRARVGGTSARTGLPQAVASASYDAANQITQFAGTSYTYDANGSLLGNASSTYTWNARGQLASLTGGSTSASFRYDAFGRRRGRTVNGTATEFLYDGGDVVQELSGSSPTANLLHGPGLDELLQRTDASGTRHLLHDGLGSTLGLLNPSGSFTHTYTYTPFGSTSETVLAGGSSANAARFTGREDDGTGLYFYRARFYHPVLQRFLSEDPLGFAGGDTNLHAYVGNDPVNATDPSGENPLLLACAFGAAQDAALYAGWQYLSGRKITLNGLGGAAVSGCIGGLVGFGVGKLFAAAMPRVAAAIGRGGLSRARGLPNSFSGDTLVATDHGERRIDGLRIGDRVLAYDEESGETSYQLVTATVSHQDAAIVRLMLDGQPLEATPEHPFSIQGRGWVHAEDLHPGDRVLRAFGGTGTVTSVTLKRHLQVMYNLSVDGAHTFFVGDDEWLVHNTFFDGPTLAQAAHDAHQLLPGGLGRSTVAAGIKDGNLWYAVFHHTRRGTEAAVRILTEHGLDVLPSPVHRGSTTHAERQLWYFGARGNIGISNQSGPCRFCKPFFDWFRDTVVTSYPRRSCR
ncbi:MAG: RHS repeat-associated core domain-containing protein [Chloroflexota bacterium]